MAASDPAAPDDVRLTGRVQARFDDLVAGSALAFPGADRVLVAREPADVVPVLAEVERTTAAGDLKFVWPGPDIFSLRGRGRRPFPAGLEAPGRGGRA